MDLTDFADRKAFGLIIIIMIVIIINVYRLYVGSI